MNTRRNQAKRGQPSHRGVEQYPFDPSLRLERVTGLDRLRCISDRSYAATLYEIYVLAERHEGKLRLEQQRLAQAAAKKERVRGLARRALAGMLGAVAQELARHVVADDVGNVRTDDAALDEFARVLAELGAI